MVWYRMVNVDLYSAIITKLTKVPNTLVSGENPGARFTNYLTIYRKFIVRSTYDSDLKSAKISFRDIVS